MFDHQSRTIILMNTKVELEIFFTHNANTNAKPHFEELTFEICIDSMNLVDEG